MIGERARIEGLEPIVGRSLYLNLGEQHRFFSNKNQMRFTPPVQVVYALAQALDEFFAEGQGARHERYTSCYDVIDKGMTELGFRRLLPESMLSKILTAYVEPDHPAYSYDQLHDRLFAPWFYDLSGKRSQGSDLPLGQYGGHQAQRYARLCRGCESSH